MSGSSLAYDVMSVLLDCSAGALWTAPRFTSVILKNRNPGAHAQPTGRSRVRIHPPAPTTCSWSRSRATARITG